MESNIATVLPELSTEQSSDLLSKFEDLGVTVWSDLKLLDPSDLQDILKKVQAKKLINSSAFDEVPSLSSSTVCCSTPKSFLSCSSDDEWDFSFNIPWESFPKDLRQACQNGVRPAHRDRLEMIRILVDKVHDINVKPKKQSWERIADKIVQTYPNSFKDEVGRIVIGNGRQSLISQLLFRSGNVNSTSKNIQKRKVNFPSASPSATIGSAETSYLVDFQKKLQSKFFIEDTNGSEIAELMKTCFPLQREHIGKKKLIGKLKQEWPFLFEEAYLFQHFELLLQKENFKQRFCENFVKKAAKIVRTMEVSMKPQLQIVLGKIKEQVRYLKNEKRKRFGILDLITTYLGENVSSLYICFEDSISFDEVLQENLEKIPAHPIVICYGAVIPASCENFGVVIERTLTMNTTSMYHAFAYAFSSYYVFDMRYPKHAKASWEFTQRYFAEIRMQVSSGAKKRKCATVHPKVLKLCNDINLCCPGDNEA